MQGSAEALSTSVAALNAADDKLQVKTRVLRSGAGAVTNEDIMLASVSNAMVLSFNSPVNKQQLDEAQRNGVEIKEYSVVYDALDDVQAMMAALIRPPPSKQLGELVGTLDVLQIFKVRPHMAPPHMALPHMAPPHMALPHMALPRAACPVPVPRPLQTPCPAPSFISLCVTPSCHHRLAPSAKSRAARSLTGSSGWAATSASCAAT